jgi:hypothetical protein
MSWGGVLPHRVGLRGAVVAGVDGPGRRMSEGGVGGASGPAGGVPPAPFSALLRAARLAAGLTQGALATRAGLSVRGIQDLERGVVAPRRSPTPASPVG